MGKTIAEKILSAHCGVDVRAGQYVVAEPDVMMTHDGNRPLGVDLYRELHQDRLADPSKIIMVIDHHTPAPGDNNAAVHKRMRDFSREFNTVFYESAGICHQLLPEQGHVKPGYLVIGTDSHTCTSGALNAFACGVGSTDLALALAYGKMWFKVPASMKIVLNGRLPKGVYAKDIILHLLGLLKANGAVYQSIEFSGEAVAELSVDGRLTICNMAVEMGAKAGIMPFDDVLAQWLAGRVQGKLEPVRPDEDAVYSAVHEIDVSGLVPQIALPHAVDKVVPVTEAAGVKLAQANLSSCTNARLEDLKVAARILRGRRVHPQVRLNVVPASQAILKEAMEQGVLQALLEAGAVLANPSCKCCSGGAMYAVPADGENVIATTNRNFQGRLGNPNAFIYLASPATVAASALAGEVTDCRKYEG